jgi:hypothetical protein
MTKLIVAVHNFVNEPKKVKVTFVPKQVMKAKRCSICIVLPSP